MYTLSMPAISTEHMPEGAVEQLGTAVLHADYGDGAFIYVGYGDDFADGPFAWLDTVALWALARLGETAYSGWVRFDRDGDVEPDLPVFDWS